MIVHPENASLRRQRGLTMLELLIAMFIVSLLAMVGLPTYQDYRVRAMVAKDFGEMRDIFLATIQEDQSDILPNVACPVRLIFGGLDTETPPEFGHRMKAFIPDSQLKIMETMTHWDVLTRGAAQITDTLVKLIEANDSQKGLS